jgi:hypothetical protein
LATHSLSHHEDKSRQSLARRVDIELDTLRNNCTWIAVQKPASAMPLHSKWVIKTKLDAYGCIERFKARLIACGNEQQADVNYNDTFTPHGFSLQRHLALPCSPWGNTSRIHQSID